MKFIRITLTLVFLVGSVALVQACETSQMTKLTIEKHVPNADVKVFDGDHADKFMEALNALRSTIYSGDEVLVASRLRAPNGFVKIYENGCATLQGYYPRRTLDAILKMLDKSERGA